MMWIPTSEMLCDEMTKDMEDSEAWEQVYAHRFWGPNHQSELLEDCVLYEEGKVLRYRIEE